MAAITTIDPAASGMGLEMRFLAGDGKGDLSVITAGKEASKRGELDFQKVNENGSPVIEQEAQRPQAPPSPPQSGKSRGKKPRAVASSGDEPSPGVTEILAADEFDITVDYHKMTIKVPVLGLVAASNEVSAMIMLLKADSPIQLDLERGQELAVSVPGREESPPFRLVASGISAVLDSIGVRVSVFFRRDDEA